MFTSTTFKKLVDLKMTPPQDEMIMLYVLNQSIIYFFLLIHSGFIF